ncbi:inner centromere protein isoform X3 [Cricetulus griseus]|uniref:Inner centromere protein n=1 Tax=Cricetulus griseus TaxID=10029 RepID=A0A9J7FKU2_CRIGR|nr:inner centromere protein isoform X3 [Cricetulus griseus]XP_027262551.1 inner centromere protein isoform X3 [Cricetulus griseus]ERE79016.1 inner centromere protein [Cricetulus griseus]
MGTTAPGPIHLLDLCDQKLLDFVCNIDNKDLMWLKEIEEEAERMFIREFSNEPELMPKTPSQKNRRKKRRVSNIQDENRDPMRKRLSRRKSRSSQLGTRCLRSKNKVEKPATIAGENGSPVLRRVTRAAAAAVATSVASAASSPTAGSPAVIKKAVVEVSAREQLSAELYLIQSKGSLSPSSVPAPATPPASQDILTSEEESTPKKAEAGKLESVAVSSFKATPQSPKNRGVGAGRSVSKLKIARASRGLQDSPDLPWQERVLSPILPNNILPTTAKSPLGDVQSVPLAKKYCLVAGQENASRRSSRRLAKKAEKEPEASARIICHSYLERLLNVEVPQKVGLEQEPIEEAESEEAAEETEVSKNSGCTSKRHSATKIVISTPTLKPVASGQAASIEEQQEAKPDQTDGHRKAPQSVRRKRSYKQAMSEPDEEQPEDEELQPPQNKTPSPPCPANKVVRPLRTFLHTVQKNQMLMTPTLASRSSVMKSFIKRNTPLRVDPKCSFVEKERQRLENLRRKEEAEQLRRQKVEEDKRRRLEEVKLKREERLRKVMQARERVEQMKEEKKKQIEQKFAQIEEKTEKAKEERLAEKAKRKAAAKRMEEVEARRKQEEEARRLKLLQQEEEARRHQETLQRKKEEELERHRAAEARRLAEQREQERQLAEQERRKEQERLQAQREMQEREKALRLQKEQLQRELEEKKKKEEQQRLAEQRLQEEQAKKAKEAAAASKVLNVTVDVQSPVCTSYQMTPQGPRSHPKISTDNYGMDLNSDDSTDDEAHPRKPIPSWARGTQLSQAIIHQYYQPPNLAELFGTILPLDLEDIFKKSKPRYHKRTSSAAWNSPPLKASRVPSSLAYSLKKP